MGLVQTLLIFALGFLSAAFIAVAAAPAIWARAVALTRRRIEASVPLTLNELQADKDQQRAEFAMTVRKLELGVKSTREKLTLTQVEVAKLEGELQDLSGERDRLNATIGDQTGTIADMTARMDQKAAKITEFEARQAELIQMVETSASEIRAKESHINELMIDADSRRIELAGSITELDRLAGEVSEVKDARTLVEQNLRSTANQLRAAQEAQRADRRRIAELEKRSDRLAAQLSDREERLDRREKEIDQYKEQVKTLTGERNDLERRFASTERQRAHLETQNAGLSQRVSKLALITTPGTPEKTIKMLENERTKLLETIDRLSRENASLQGIAHQPITARQASDGGGDLLREKIHELTAKVVKLTADEEGADSPIPALLSKIDKKAASVGRSQELPVSLADRIRALEHAARRS